MTSDCSAAGALAPVAGAGVAVGEEGADVAGGAASGFGVGIEQDLSKTIVKLIKDSKMKVQASIQGDAVRVSGAKRDDLQNAIALVKKSVTDFPVQFGNFRD